MVQKSVLLPLWSVVFRMGDNLEIRPEKVLKIDVVYGFVVLVLDQS